MSKKFLRSITSYDQISALTGSSELPINQQDSTGKLGWRTVSANLDSVYSLTKQLFSEQNFLEHKKVDYSSGLKGTGKPDSPFELDYDKIDVELIPSEFTPISQIGDVWSNKPFTGIGISNYHGKTLVSIDERLICFLAGMNFTLGPRMTFTYTEDEMINFGVRRTNEPLFLYMEIVNGSPRVFPSQNKLPESPTLTCFALMENHQLARYPNAPITLIGTYFGTCSGRPYIRIGNYRLSDLKRGSAIPVSANHPFTEQFTLWE